MKHVQASILIVLAVCGGCASTSNEPAKTEDAVASPAPAAPPAVELVVASKSVPVERLFPVPTEPLSIPALGSPRKAGPLTLEDLLAEMERLTAVRFMATNETRMILSRIPPGNMQALVVPPDRVWPVFEAILCELDFCLGFVSTEAPIVLSVFSTQPQAGRHSGPREHAVHVASNDLAKWVDHPAFLVTTAVHLNDLNVRDLCNSMRQMFTDPSSQQIVPLGDANAVLITGRARSVIDIVSCLQRVNESERVRREKLLAAEREKSASSVGAAPQK